ncbi:MAG: hypothetical protein CM15mP74_25410 [Halieaceae bacterium]|nr:MAG: hypothetical protein CM15mP74_25410 [Halieaceae bacterium]
MVNDLKYFDGSVQTIDRIPDDLKAKYATAFEVEPRWLVDSASRRQSGSTKRNHSICISTMPVVRSLDVTYRMAWYSGLKTTYYLRSLAATGTEKSTVEQAISMLSRPPQHPSASASATSLLAGRSRL